MLLWSVGILLWMIHLHILGFLRVRLIPWKAHVLDVRCSPALTHVAQSGRTVDYRRGVPRVDSRSKNAESAQSWSRYVLIVSVALQRADCGRTFSETNTDSVNELGFARGRGVIG